MTALIKSHLRRLYYQHGLFTFLFFFVPVFPGFIETHTHTYLSLIKKLSLNVTDAHMAIKVMFGQRGLSAYDRFLALNPDLIRPPQIFRAFYQAPNQIPSALDSLELLLLDPRQRQYPLSDIFRETIYAEIPYMSSFLRQLKSHSHRKRLHSLFHQSLLLEQAPTALTIAQASRLKLEHQEKLELAQAKTRFQNALHQRLALSHLALLVKPTSIYSAPISP